MFKIMLNVPSKGIYCLINEVDKLVYIKHSVDITMSIARVIADIRSKNIVYKQFIRDRKKLKFIFLEELKGDESLLDIHLRIDSHINNFNKQGYKLYNSKYRISRFKVNIEVQEDLHTIHVILASRNRLKKIVVGVFDKMYDAEEFATQFDNMEVVRPVYASNELSKKYFLNQALPIVKRDIE